MNSLSYSQTATKTPVDSLVILPKKLVVYMLQDLSQCDNERIELQKCSEALDLSTQFIEKQKEIEIVQLHKYNNTYNLLRDVQSQRDSLEIDSKNLDLKLKKVKKKRNTFFISSLLFLGIIFLK